MSLFQHGMRLNREPCFQRGQGDQDGLKGLYGLYRINTMDCVTQWQLVATCEKLSEAYLLPVIEALLAA